MKNLYRVLGSVLALVGILGFVTPSPLLGVFEVNALHNIVHLTTGALTFVAATQSIGAMRLWGKILGAIYLAVGIAGFASPDMFGLMHVKAPDNLFHLGLAAAYLYVGLLAPPR